MAVNTRTYAGKGIVHFENFKRVERGHWQYDSPFQPKIYDLYLIQKEDGKYYWQCNCADARKVSHPQGKPCKHEIALAQMLKARYEQKCMAEIQAEEIAAEAERQAEQKHGQAEEIAALRAEVEALRGQLAEIQSQPAPDITAILAEIATLKAENAEIKRVMATKATARKKHMSEMEAAQLKQDINVQIDDAVEAAKTAIYAADQIREKLADLEAIPHELKAELDSWTEAGKEELQPDYKAPDYVAPEIKASIRKIKEEMAKKEAAREAKAAKIAEQMRQRHEDTQLGEGQGFQFWK